LGVVLLLVGLGWYVVIRQSQVLTQATMVAYQQTELELVQAIARSVETYTSDQARTGETSDIATLEEEIFERFIAPVKLLDHGNTWVYASNRVIFSNNLDFPPESQDATIAEIFELQADAGANHYEELVDGITNAREGVSWYVWLPETGIEVAAWTPVYLNGQVWVVGISTPLPEILESTGAAIQIRTSYIIMTVGTLISLILLIAWWNSMVKRGQAEQALRESEQRFRRVVSSVSDHIYMSEGSPQEKFNIVYLSPNIETLTGYPRQQFQQDRSFWRSLIHPDDQAIFDDHLARLGQADHSEVEYRLNRADGTTIWVRDSGRAEEDKLQNKIAVYGVVADITRRKQNEEVLAVARDQALEASRLKSQLLANVSHDLRTPLTTIIGYAQLLDMSAQNILSEKQLRNVTGIIESAQYLTTLVNNLLDQAKLEEGKLKLNIVPFDPADIIDQIETNMKVPAQTKGLDLMVGIEPDVPDSLSGDPDRVHQILANLVNNAIKFTEEGSVKVRFYRPDMDHWAIQVSDTGPGIPPEAHAYIFEAFRQVDGNSHQSHNGSGLGLSIVKQLTTLMGGSVLLESEVGCGATFTITLPIEPPEEEMGA
jgi:PAS domain S-box-containing protein